MDNKIKEMQKTRAEKVWIRRFELISLTRKDLVEKYLELYDMSLQKTDMIILMEENKKD